ncbi:hypothetical protein CSIRO_3390 [Bradyrhizobiaceae bacterium SG-6C]|nr:hypothetical protein CSIRO_3390 [Bradyrhizobiaceae bacterium SG-6C]
MNRAWASSIENLWHSQSLPMWLTIAAAGFFAIVLLVTLFRAERSVANGALTVITLLAIGIAVTMMLRGSGSGASADLKSATVSAGPSLPALACLDGLAGESVETACEKALFASADTAAAGVSYTAAQVSRLAAFGSAVNANKAMTPELNALRRTIERDRYGFVAQVLKTREGCSLSAPCPFFQSLTNSAQISSNMSENLYDSLIERYAASWNAPAATAAAPAGASTAAAAALGTVPPPGRPVSGDFPSAASIPPINIMTPEPAAQGSQAAQRPAAEPAASPTPRSSPGAVINPQPAPTAAKKAAPTQHKSRAQAPVQLAPPKQSDDN